jgi:hypothetical protein
MGLNSTLIIKIEHKHKIWVWNFSNYSQYEIPKTLFRLYWKSSSQALKSYEIHIKEKKDKGLSPLLKFGSLWKLGSFHLGSFHIWGKIFGRKRMDFRHWAAYKVVWRAFQWSTRLGKLAMWLISNMEMASWQCAIHNLVIWTYDSIVNLVSWWNGCELGQKKKSKPTWQFSWANDIP